MKIYYLEYEDEQGEVTVEAFKNRRLASERVAQMTHDYKTAKKAWQEYIITKRNKPTVTPKEPPKITEVEFEINGEGLLQAFTYFKKRGTKWK